MIDISKLDALIERYGTDPTHNAAHESGKDCSLCSMAKELKSSKFRMLASNALVVGFFSGDMEGAIFDCITLGFILGRQYAENEALENLGALESPSE